MERVSGGDLEKALPSATIFFQRLIEKVSALPGVESTGYISSLPMGSQRESDSFSIVNHPAPPPDRRPRTELSKPAPVFSVLCGYH